MPADNGSDGRNWQSSSLAAERSGRRSACRPLLSDRICLGHRIVHGGPDYDRPVMIDHGVVARLERFVALAPLHQPHNVTPIRSLLTNFPTLPQVACFFFQAEDGIRDGRVTGVQTCALPI